MKPEFERAIRTGYGAAWRLLRWLAMPMLAYLALAGWVVIAAAAFGAGAAIGGPAVGAVLAIAAAALLPATWGAFLTPDDPNH